jgi:hypothetical protein
MDELDELMDWGDEQAKVSIQGQVIAEHIPKTIMLQVPNPKTSPFPIPKATPPKPRDTDCCPHCGGDIGRTYMKQKIAFKGIVTLTVYPNGMMAANISKALGGQTDFKPKTKVLKQSNVKFGESVGETVELG